jgi:hypothetical protein
MTELAGNLLSSVFGGQTGAVTQALSEYAGVRSTSASSLMTLASGLVTAALGERVRLERRRLRGAIPGGGQFYRGGTTEPSYRDARDGKVASSLQNEEYGARC